MGDEGSDVEARPWVRYAVLAVLVIAVNAAWTYDVWWALLAGLLLVIAVNTTIVRVRERRRRPRPE